MKLSATTWCHVVWADTARDGQRGRLSQTSSMSAAFLSCPRYPSVSCSGSVWALCSFLQSCSCTASAGRTSPARIWSSTCTGGRRRPSPRTQRLPLGGSRQTRRSQLCVRRALARQSLRQQGQPEKCRPSAGRPACQEILPYQPQDGVAADRQAVTQGPTFSCSWVTVR